MATATIFKSSRQIGTCHGARCGARILWVELTNHKRMPFDDLVLEPLHSTVNAQGHVIETVPLDKTHFATCPDRDRFRKKR